MQGQEAALPVFDLAFFEAVRPCDTSVTKPRIPGPPPTGEGRELHAFLPLWMSTEAWQAILRMP